MATDPLADLSAEIAAEDLELQAEAKTLMKLALRQAKIDLVTGTPQVRHSLMRSLIPSMIKAAAETDKVDEFAAMREQMEQMQKVFQAGIATGIQVSTEPEVNTDGLPTDAPMRVIPGGLARNV